MALDEKHTDGDGGPAFPEAIAVSAVGDVYLGYHGMSLRDWFAGRALSSTAMHIADYIADATPAATAIEAKQLADAAYMMADAMLTARTKVQP